MRVLNLVTNPDARFYRQQLRALADAGIACDTLAVPAAHDASRAEGRRSPLDYLRFVPRAVRAARAGGTPGDGYDLVHANYGLTAPAALAQKWLPGGRGGGLLPGGRGGGWLPDLDGGVPSVGGLPVVLSLWGSDLLGPVGPVSRLCARGCDEVVVMAPHMADALGVECRVVPHGVDLDRFRPMDRSAARAAVGWADDRAHVLFPYPPAQTVKNHPLAVRVVAAADARLDRPVELRSVSGVPHEEMPAYVNAADALLLVSDREGSPNAVKEALACNVPVVATDVGDVRERLAGVEPSAVRTDEAGLVDALVAVLAADCRSNGRERAREVGLERMSGELVAAYESALDG